MEEQRCPCCSNHCNREKLKCKKGKRYFGAARKASKSELGEELQEGQKLLRDCKKLIKKCAKRARRGEMEEALGNLSEEEMQTLCALLKKSLKR
ncbi:MAG: hypothetical protein ACI4L9_06585 [Candidatus Coproplasma sp.]